jgi:hypothetical protein
MINKRWLYIAFLILLLTACECSSGDSITPIPTPRPNQPWIDAPLPNSIIRLQPYKIMFHGASDDEITEFEVTINGNLIAVEPPISADPNETLFFGEYLWVPPAPGTYTIQVRAFEEEQVSFPNKVQITVFGYEEVVTPLPTEDIEEVEGCTFRALVNIYCRLGPGKEYIDIGFFFPDEAVPVVGRTEDDIYWYVIAPDTGNECTVPNNIDYGVVEGDCSSMPIIIPVPLPILTPTPESACTVEQLIGGILCVSPCPSGAVPGDPCVP